MINSYNDATRMGYRLPQAMREIFVQFEIDVIEDIEGVNKDIEVRLRDKEYMEQLQRM